MMPISVDKTKSRYIVGIDLGTTNSAVAYVDTNLNKNPSFGIQLFQVPQFNNVGIIESLAMLPSFIYLAESHELPHEEKIPPWMEGRDTVIGAWAREQGAKVPTRLVQSAKSWLTNAAAGRKDKILPFESADDTRKLSPVEAAANYLRHIKDAWNFTKAKARAEEELEEQQVVLTVPASFDEIARSLTLEAAKKAGLSNVRLLEEPQAAFYSWMMENENKLGNLKPGETVLVCDVGGGTTDFSLIEVIHLEGEIGFQRMSVGDHLLLGGDNIDRTIAYFLEERLKKSSYDGIDANTWLLLCHQARSAKEYLLEKGEGSVFSFWVPGKGSSIIKGGIGLEITFEEVQRVLLDGFFGLYEFKNAIEIKRKNALRNVGLAYENEPSITKHLASFLKQSQVQNKPRYILFNGGTMKPPVFQERIIQSLNNWFSADHFSLQTLMTKSFDLAVAKGAAYFGKVQRGIGVRIGGGSARSYYLGIDIKKEDGTFEKQALTILERGTEEGSKYVPEYPFSLLSNSPVSFELYRSHTRLKDSIGTLIPIEEEKMSQLPPIKTVLRYGKQKEQTIPIKLEVLFTEIGTLELWLQSQVSEHRWKLEFQLRGESQEESTIFHQAADETFDKEFLESTKEMVKEAFSIGHQSRLNKLIPTLEKRIEKKRNEWPPTFLRTLFESILTQSEKRNLSSVYESKFWNLAGFFLRPGIGYPLDDHRIKEMWKLVLADFKKAVSEDVQIQKWIFYRRIAAGLKKGQQLQIFNDLFPTLFDKKNRSNSKYAYSEKLRTLASLELVDNPLKIKLGKFLLERILSSKAEGFEFWALGRIGSRHLIYGSIGNVISRKICEEWVERLMAMKVKDHKDFPFLIFMLAQKTDSREINISEELFQAVENFILDAQTDLGELLKKERELTHKEHEQIFGDSLPAGLTLKIDN